MLEHHPPGEKREAVCLLKPQWEDASETKSVLKLKKTRVIGNEGTSIQNFTWDIQIFKRISQLELNFLSKGKMRLKFY